MNSICPEINIAIKLAVEFGNSVKESTEGWSKAKQVIYMQKKLDPILKNKIEKEINKLRFRSYKGSPHNEPDEGFICDECKVVISFPVARRVVR